MCQQTGVRVSVREMDLGDGVCDVHVCPCPDPAVQYSTGCHHEELVSKSAGAVRADATQTKNRHDQDAVSRLLCPYIHDNTSQYRLFLKRQIPFGGFKFYRQYI